MNSITRKGWLALLLTAGLVYGLGACNPTVKLKPGPDPDPSICEGVDFGGDPYNCGSCGNVCADDEQCVGGVCQFDDWPCGPNDDLDCGVYCADSLNDISNCGGCGIQCGFGEFCDAGVCAVNNGDCPFDGDVRCNGVCIDVLYDANNCGGCGVICGDGICESGACVSTGCDSPGVCGACDVQELPPVPFGLVAGGPPSSVNALEPDCGAPGSPETTFRYVATQTGVHVFDTFGASGDTVLYVIDVDGCGRMMCNDDAPEVLQSEVAVSLTQGQEVLVVVDGYGGEAVIAHLNGRMQ